MNEEHERMKPTPVPFLGNVSRQLESRSFAPACHAYSDGVSLTEPTEAPFFEVEYRITPEDRLHFIRVHMASRRKDPLFVARVELAAWGIVTVAAVALLLWMYFSGRYPRSLVRAIALMVSVLCWKGYQGYKLFREAHAKLYKDQGYEEPQILRAYETHLTIARPGKTVLSVDWKIVRRVELGRHFLQVFTIEQLIAYVPVRFVAPDQWAAMQAFLEGTEA